jgi:hypothetical protein
MAIQFSVPLSSHHYHHYDWIHFNFVQCGLFSCFELNA